MEKITPLLEKYHYFKDAQIRSIEHLEDGSKVVHFVIQDDDGEDVSTVAFTFKNVKESRLLQNNVLAFLDMMSGISIIQDKGFYGFALGRGSAMLHVLNAPMYVIASEVSIEEKAC